MSLSYEGGRSPPNTISNGVKLLQYGGIPGLWRKIVEGWPNFHWSQGHTQLKFLWRSYPSFLSVLSFLAYKHNVVSNQHVGPLSDLGSWL